MAGHWRSMLLLLAAAATAMLAAPAGALTQQQAKAQCPQGILSADGKVCCSAGCKACAQRSGGRSCARRRGGAALCCPDTILTRGVYCTADGRTPAPCTVNQCAGVTCPYNKGCQKPGKSPPCAFRSAKGAAQQCVTGFFAHYKPSRTALTKQQLHPANKATVRPAG